MEYSELVTQDASEAEIQRFHSDGEQIAFTVRIPKNLKKAASDIASMRGISFSAFVRNCMIQGLSKRN